MLMLVKIYIIDSPNIGRVPVWTCLIIEIIHYADYKQLESKYLQQICKCMHDMYEMHNSNYEYATELCR